MQEARRIGVLFCFVDDLLQQLPLRVQRLVLHKFKQHLIQMELNQSCTLRCAEDTKELKLYVQDLITEETKDTYEDGSIYMAFVYVITDMYISHDYNTNVELFGVYGLWERVRASRECTSAQIRQLLTIGEAASESWTWVLAMFIASIPTLKHAANNDCIYRAPVNRTVIESHMPVLF